MLVLGGAELNVIYAKRKTATLLNVNREKNTGALPFNVILNCYILEDSGQTNAKCR